MAFDIQDEVDTITVDCEARWQRRKEVIRELLESAERRKSDGRVMGNIILLPVPFTQISV